MVTRIKYSANIRKPFHYNDKKVQEGTATLLVAENMLLDLDRHPEMAVLLLEKQVALRPDIEKSALHISLNFSPDEQLSDERMQAIAKDYMEGIGFGNQPYLVYRHHDSGHPHCHIVSTNICLDKSRISTHGNFKRSEQIRKMLEEKYHLVKAERRNNALSPPKEIEASKVIYGKTATKSAIENVLNEVVDKYKFTSLAELNAVLSLYNVRADSGEKGTRLKARGGLYYRVLNKEGKAVGIPIKASLFAQNRTLKVLQKKYLRNDLERQKFADSIRSRIDVTLKFRKPESLMELKEQLKEKDIRLVPRVNEQGVIYGLTYVDSKHKVVFNGSALGKPYSAKAILEKIHLKEDVFPIAMQHSLKQNTVPGDREPFFMEQMDWEQYGRLSEKSALELLSQYEYASSAVPNEWRKSNKKRKKRRGLR